jgi:hypothetical protein
MQIKPLVKPTRAIINFRGLQYAWHDFVSKSMENITFSTCYNDMFYLVCILGSHNISLFFIWKIFLGEVSLSKY